MILRDKTRGTDTVWHCVGGEEFLVPLPAADRARKPLICAERFRKAVEEHVFDAGRRDIKATISIGIASRIPEMSLCTDLLRIADSALCR